MQTDTRKKQGKTCTAPVAVPVTPSTCSTVVPLTTLRKSTKCSCGKTTKLGCRVCLKPLCGGATGHGQCQSDHTCSDIPVIDFTCHWGRLAMHVEWKGWRDARFYPQFESDILQLISTQDEETYDVILDSPLIKELDRLIHRMTPGTSRGRVCAVASTSSEIIDMLPALANLRASNLPTPPDRGHILVMQECYLSGRPSSVFARHGRKIFEARLSPFMDRTPSEHVHTVDFPVRPCRGVQVSAEEPLTTKEKVCLKEIKNLLHSNPITVAVIETVSACTVMQLSGKFLDALHLLLRNHSVHLVVDDTMMSIRCGQFFSHQLFRGFQPEFVVVGKHWGVSMLISFLPPRLSSSKFPFIAGFTTCQISALALRKAVHTIQLMVEHSLHIACQQIETVFRDVLVSATEATPGAILHFVGAIAYTTLRLNSASLKTMAYNRLLPPFTIPLELLRTRIQHVGGLIPLTG